MDVKKGDWCPKLFPQQQQKNPFSLDEALCSKDINVSYYLILIIVIILNY